MTDLKLANACRETEEDIGNVRTGVIYLALNIFNGKCYVGLSDDFVRRKRHHVNPKLWGDSHFHRAMRKWGPGAFLWVILERDIPMSELGKRESYWISVYDSFRNGYNQTTGDGRRIHSEQTKEKIRASHLARVARGEHNTQLETPEQKLARHAKIGATQKSLAARGEHCSQRPEVRAKRSVTMKAKAARGEMWLQSPEGQARMSAIQQDLLARGEHYAQRETPEAKAKRAAKLSARMKELGARGELATQRPDVKAKIAAGHRANHQRKLKEKRLAQIEAGQQFLAV